MFSFTKYLRSGLVLSAIFLLVSNTTIALDNEVSSVSSETIALSAVKLQDLKHGGSDCSGVLVERQWVLAIAHCGDVISNRTNARDVSINRANPPYARFTIGAVDSNIQATFDREIDRVIRVDGAENNDNSVVLFHLIEPAPSWSSPVELYRGKIPDRNEEIIIFGFDDEATRRGGIVKIKSVFWEESDTFWAFNLEPDPSKIEGGDSGGPLFAMRSGRYLLIGVNWQAGGGASAGYAAATFDIDDDNRWNPTGTLIERIIKPASIIPDGIYQVKALHSGKCLDVPGSSQENEVNVIQYNCTNARNQQWRFVRHGDFYEIRAIHSGKCLDVPHSSSRNVELIQYACNNTTNQRWRLSRIGRNSYDIQAQHSAKCVDVKSSEMDDLTKVIQYKCTKARNQRWELTNQN